MNHLKWFTESIWGRRLLIAAIEIALWLLLIRLVGSSFSGLSPWLIGPLTFMFVKVTGELLSAGLFGMKEWLFAEDLLADVLLFVGLSLFSVILAVTIEDLIGGQVSLFVLALFSFLFLLDCSSSSRGDVM